MLKAQTSVKLLPANNVIYRGLYNHIEIKVEGYDYHQLSIRTEGCELKGGYPNAYLVASKMGNCLVSVSYKTNDTLHTDTFSFRVKDAPLPEPRFGTLESGEYNVLKLLKQDYLSARIPNVVCLGFINIVSYQWKYSGDLNYTSISDTVNGSKIPLKLKLLIGKTKYSGVVKINKVKCEINGGSAKELEGMELYISSSDTTRDRPEFIVHRSDIDQRITYHPYQPFGYERGGGPFSPGVLKFYQINDKDTVFASEMKTNYNKILYEKQYYPNGKLKAEYHFEKNDSLGNAILYYENGQIRSKGKVIPWNSQVIEKYNWKWGDSEKRSFIDSFLTNRYAPYGSWNGYYENGTLAMDCNFDLVKVSLVEEEEIKVISTYYFLSEINRSQESIFRTEIKGAWKFYNKEGSASKNGNY